MRSYEGAVEGMLEVVVDVLVVEVERAIIGGGEVFVDVENERTCLQLLGHREVDARPEKGQSHRRKNSRREEGDAVAAGAAGDLLDERRYGLFAVPILIHLRRFPRACKEYSQRLLGGTLDLPGTTPRPSFVDELFTNKHTTALLLSSGKKERE